MSGIKLLFISKDCKVFKIPQPKNLVYKPLKELAGQEVLEVILFYETKDRKPSKLLTIHFDRLKLNSEGRYVMKDEDRHRGMHNFFEFGLTTPEKLADRDSRLALPIAPVIPLAREKDALYTYLKDKFPVLAKDAPLVVEKVTRSAKQSHKRNINLIKQAKKLKEGKYESGY